MGDQAYILFRRVNRAERMCLLPELEGRFWVGGRSESRLLVEEDAEGDEGGS